VPGGMQQNPNAQPTKHPPQTTSLVGLPPPQPLVGMPTAAFAHPQNFAPMPPQALQNPYANPGLMPAMANLHPPPGVTPPPPNQQQAQAFMRSFVPQAYGELPVENGGLKMRMRVQSHPNLHQIHPGLQPARSHPNLQQAPNPKRQKNKKTPRSRRGKGGLNGPSPGGPANNQPRRTNSFQNLRHGGQRGPGKLGRSKSLYNLKSSGQGPRQKWGFQQQNQGSGNHGQNGQRGPKVGGTGCGATRRRRRNRKKAQAFRLAAMRAAEEEEAKKKAAEGPKDENVSQVAKSTASASPKGSLSCASQPVGGTGNTAPLVGSSAASNEGDSPVEEKPRRPMRRSNTWSQIRRSRSDNTLDSIWGRTRASPEPDESVWGRTSEQKTRETNLLPSRPMPLRPAKSLPNPPGMPLPAKALPMRPAKSLPTLPPRPMPAKSLPTLRAKHMPAKSLPILSAKPLPPSPSDPSDKTSNGSTLPANPHRGGPPPGLPMPPGARPPSTFATKESESTPPAMSAREEATTGESEQGGAVLARTPVARKNRRKPKADPPPMPAGALGKAALEPPPGIPALPISKKKEKAEAKTNAPPSFAQPANRLVNRPALVLSTSAPTPISIFSDTDPKRADAKTSDLKAPDLDDEQGGGADTDASVVNPNDNNSHPPPPTKLPEAALPTIAPLQASADPAPGGGKRRKKKSMTGRTGSHLPASPAEIAKSSSEGELPASNVAHETERTEIVEKPASKRDSPQTPPPAKASSAPTLTTSNSYPDMQAAIAEKITRMRQLPTGAKIMSGVFLGLALLIPASIYAAN